MKTRSNNMWATAQMAGSRIWLSVQFVPAHRCVHVSETVQYCLCKSSCYIPFLRTSLYVRILSFFCSIHLRVVCCSATIGFASFCIIWSDVLPPSTRINIITSKVSYLTRYFICIRNSSHVYDVYVLAIVSMFNSFLFFNDILWINFVVVVVLKSC